MIHVIEQYNAEKYPLLMEQMFRLRASVFHDHLKWDVEVVEGRERDKYDGEGPVYIIYTDDDARIVKGSLRLLPTTGPTVLADFFSDTLPAGVQISAPTTWECTRFCLNDRVLHAGNRSDMVYACVTLLVALGKVAINAGIETILGNFDSAMLKLYRHVGCEVDVLGSTLRFGRPVYLGSFEVSERIVRKLERSLKKLSASGYDREVFVA